MKNKEIGRQKHGLQEKKDEVLERVNDRQRFDREEEKQYKSSKNKVSSYYENKREGYLLFEDEEEKIQEKVLNKNDDGEKALKELEEELTFEDDLIDMKDVKLGLDQPKRSTKIKGPAIKKYSGNKGLAVDPLISMKNSSSSSVKCYNPSLNVINIHDQTR